MPAPDAAAKPSGLNAAEAARLLSAHGPNELPTQRTRTLWRIALDTLREPMFLLLLAAGGLYLAFGSLHEGLTLLACVLASLALTLFQEGRTERAIEALRDLTSPRALVLRDGREQRIAGREVVPGDLLLLREGDRIAADARLLQVDQFHVDESLLTGESVSVRKRAAGVADLAARPGGDDQPWVYAGTLVVQGQALSEVTATGVRSEIGRIGSALGAVEVERSPLQRQVARLVRALAITALVLSIALTLLHGLLRGDWLQAALAGIALAMALLPEEFPVVMTVFPALGAWRLSRIGVLTRRLTALEALGATSVLCTDKTGTLTENRMTVVRLVAGGAALSDRLALDATPSAALPEAFHALVEYSILASVVDAYDPMEQAFHRLGQATLAGTEHLHRDWTLVQTYGLTPALRAMSHVWTAPEGGVHAVAAKGAPEAVVDLCHLGPEAAARVAAVVDTLAAEGLRVLAVARGRFEGEAWPAGEHDFDFEFVGLLGLSDPLRAQVPAAVRECQAAGVRVLMITGDYPVTARAIAAQAGLPVTDVLSGDELATLDDAALRERLRSTHVCARIAPAQKLRIVQALKADGQIVAMTGDGVNDAPALRAAHVGIAMGARGTDVAREAASLVLLDDNFTSVVRAVRLGRRIFDNLHKSMSYLLAVHVPIAGMALLPVLLGWPPLLYPVHIALLELLIDPACSLAFENEPEEADLMQRPPRDVEAPLFSGTALAWALAQGAGALALILGGTAWAQGVMSEPAARGFAFAVLLVANVMLIVSNRSHSRDVFGALAVRNPMQWVVAGSALAVIALTQYWPWAAGGMRFAPLPARDLAIALALGLASGLWFDGVRRLRGR